jgi:hypothetical protein
MPNLLPFIFNTIRTRAIDPANKRFFLPGVLEGISGDNSRGKLLPIEQDSWSIGEVKGSEGATVTTGFIDNWATYLEKVKKVNLSNQYPIANPASPAPKLTLGDGKTKIMINGLQNVFVNDNPNFVSSAGGYTATLTLTFNYWDGTGGRPSIPALSLSTPYTLEQSLCLADTNAGTCNGNASTDIDGDGMASVSVTDAFVDAVVEFSIANSGPSGREIVVNVKSLLFRGTDEATPPAINIIELTIGAKVSNYLINVWKTMASSAIQSPEGRAGIFQNLNAALNQPSTLAGISGQMTTNLASGLNSVLGTVTGTLPPVEGMTTENAVDRYIFDRARVALNEPASTMFLPQLLCQNDNLSLSPLKIAQADLPDLNIMGMAFQQGKLVDLRFNGLTNVKVPPSEMTMGGGSMQFGGVLGGWNPPPKVSCAAGIPAPPATGSSQFSFVPKGSPMLTGGLQLTLTTAQLNGLCQLSGKSDAELTIAIKSLNIEVADVVSNMHVTLDIKSAFKKFINDAANTQKMLQRILDELNKELANNYADLGTQVTKYARQAIDNALR